MASFKEIAQSKGVTINDDNDCNGQPGGGQQKRMRRPWFNEDEVPRRVEPEVVESKTIEDAWLNAKKKMTVIKNSQPKDC